MAKPITTGQIKNILGSMVDTVGKRRDGSFVIRLGFYYRHGVDAEAYRIAVTKKLNGSGLNYSLKDWGEKWTTFRGGASISNQSHWFVEIWVNQHA